MTQSSRHEVHLAVMTQFMTQNAGVTDDTVQDTTFRVTDDTVQDTTSRVTDDTFQDTTCRVRDDTVQDKARRVRDDSSGHSMQGHG